MQYSMRHEVKWTLNQVDTIAETDPNICEGCCVYRTEMGYGFTADVAVSPSLPKVIWIHTYSEMESGFVIVDSTDSWNIQTVTYVHAESLSQSRRNFHAYDWMVPVRMDSR